MHHIIFLLNSTALSPKTSNIDIHITHTHTHTHTLRRAVKRLLISCVCVCAQSCLTLCNPMDCRPPGFSVNGIFRARILDGLLFPTSRDLPTQGSNPRLLHLLHWQAGSLPLHHVGSSRVSQIRKENQFCSST